MLGKYIGSVFILIGAAIGAGMLALPMVGAAAGFWWSAILIIIIWAMMTTTALMTLEVCLAFKPYRNSFGTMAARTLGMPGKVVAWIAYMMLLYATTASYIAGSTSLLDEVFKVFFDITLPPWLSALIFTLVFGCIVFWSMRTVDYFVRFLLSAKGILLIATLFVLMPYVDYANLIMRPHSFSYLWVAPPIFLNAFGFHFVIPSVCIYCNRKYVPIRRIIILSSTIPLVIYLAWLFVSLGIIPIAGAESFTTVVHQNTSVGGFIETLGMIVDRRYILYAINAFSNIAMTTSFLGVTLGLFDFLADGFKRSNDRFGRFQTALLTFIPPLIFALFFPSGFIMALEYSTFFAIALEIFLPPLMVYSLRRSKSLRSPYRFFMNAKFAVILFVAIGIALVGLVLADRLKVLPTPFN